MGLNSQKFVCRLLGKIYKMVKTDKKCYDVIICKVRWTEKNSPFSNLLLLLTWIQQKTEEVASRLVKQPKT